MTVEKSQVFGWINRISAVGYLAAAVLVGWRAAAGHASILGSVVLAAFLTWQAIGHWQRRAWALQATAAVFLVGNLLAIPYLLAVFEAEILPPTPARVVHFVLITLLTSAMVANYAFKRRLDGATGKR